MFAMTLHFRRCFIFMRIFNLIVSSCFFIINLAILILSDTTLYYREDQEETELVTNSQRAPAQIDSFNVKLLFVFLVSYHLIEIFSNSAEILSIQTGILRNKYNMLFSFNGCFGLAIFVWAQILIFGQLYNVRLKTQDQKLIYYWIIIEVAFFYLFCL